MKKLFFPFAIFVLFITFVQPHPVAAHPADLYVHNINVALTADQLSIQWEIKPGPMLVSNIWFDADANNDDSVSDVEAAQWASSRIALFTVTLNNTSLPLQVDKLQFPSSRDAFQSGAETIKIYLSAAWLSKPVDDYQLVIHNGVEEQKSVSWYTVIAQDGLKFQTPQQKNSILTLNVLKPSAQASSQDSLRTNWDTSMPSLPQDQVTTTKSESNTSTLSSYIPSGKNTSQDILLNLVRQKDLSLSFYLLALGISLLLGALHALTPGHGKTVVAAYLVGSRGTSWHAIALGTVVTLTHTGSVFLLGIITLMASRYILPTSIIPMLEILSGLLIVGLGLYLFWQRYQQWRQAKRSEKLESKKRFSIAPVQATKKPIGKYTINAFSTHSHHDHIHTHSHDHGDGHVHSHEVPEEITWRSLITLGVSGGLVPCPDAIAILLVAVTINRILLGLALIVSFSLGLAIVLITIGLLMVSSRRLFDRVSIFDRFAPVLPMTSAVIVLALGVVLTSSAVVQAKGNFNATGAGSGSAKEAQIIYLAGAQDQVKQLFIANVDGKNPLRLSDSSDNVVEYTLSPDNSKVIYTSQTESLENKIWSVDIASRAKSKLLDCNDAICSRPVWSPDGKQIIYEYTRISGDNVTGMATLWWVDVATGDTKPVFQEAQLPGSNPRWSPNGKWLSYVTSQDVRLYNLESGESHIVKSTLAAGADWSPDGKSVLYRDVVIQGGQFVTQLFVYNLTSQTPTNITLNQNYENIFAAWSPDGTQIAVIRRDLSITQGDQIWIMNTDGSNAHALTDQPNQLHGNLSWSSDGKNLLYDVYEVNSSLESNIQMIDVVSGKITDTSVKGYNAKWVLH